MYTNVADMPFAVNSKETGTISASHILKPLWRLTCRSSPVLLNDKALQHSRVFATHGFPQRPLVWLQPIIQQVLWRYRSSLYRVHWPFVIGVHWCALVYIGVHWCTLVYIGVHWCTLYILGNIGVHK